MSRIFSRGINDYSLFSIKFGDYLWWYFIIFYTVAIIMLERYFELVLRITDFIE